MNNPQDIVKQITGMGADELEAFSQTGPLAERAADAIEDAFREIHRLEEDLRREIAGAQRDLTNAIHALDNGLHVNERGILQSAPLRIDQLAALRPAAYDRLKRAAHMVKAVADSA